MLPMKSRFLALVAGTSVIALSMAMPGWAQTASENKTKETEASSSDVDAVVVVTARRKALQSAIEIKRKADTIVDSIVADEAGKLPDNSITEVLQRVSGVSISRFGATNGGSAAFQIEGTGITVRGLPFNSSTLNGRQLFSANGASAISWNEVTPELMAGVDVYKASRADLIEGGTSLINLRTHLPFDFKAPQLNLTMGTSYGSQVKKASPRVSALFSKRFDTNIGEIGVLWDFAYSRLNQQGSNLQVGAMFGQYVPTSVRDDKLAFVPSSFDWGYDRSQRDRFGAYQAIQWRPTESLTLTNTVFYTQYSTERLSNNGGLGQSPSASAAIQPKVGSPVEYDANGALVRGTLVYGSTGKRDPLGNTSVDVPGWEWLPSQYKIDCGATYGAPASTIQWDWSGGPILAQCSPPGALNVNSSAGASRTKNSTLDISQSFVWQPSDQLAVRGSLQYVLSRSTGKDISIGMGRYNSKLSSFDVDLTGELPVLSGFDSALVLDPSTVHFASFAYHEPDNKGEMYAGNLDFEYTFSEDGFLRKISAGIRASQRVEDDNFAGTYWTSLGQTWNQKPAGAAWAASGPGNIQFLNNPNVPQADWTTTTFPNFFGGDVAVPSQLLVASPALLQRYDWYYLLKTYNGLPVTVGGVAVPQPTPEQYFYDRIEKGLARVKTRIDNRAAYISARFAHEGMGIIPAFSGNIGVRVFQDKLIGTALVRTGSGDQRFAASIADSNAYFLANPPGNQPGIAPAPGAVPKIYTFRESFTPQTRTYEYTRVLPSFNIKFDVTDKFIIRAAASVSASPPNLDASRPGGDVTPRSVPNPTNSQALPILTGFTVNGGGANLKPTMISSQDITFEYYPSSSSFLYVDVFAKQIKDQPQFYSFIANNLPVPGKQVTINDQGKVVLDGPASTGQPILTDVSLDLPWLYLQDRPSPEKATIKGFELGGRKFFDQLPGWLRGFGIDANLTYIDSRNPAQLANSVLTPPPANGSQPGLNPDGTVPQTYPNLPYAGLSKWAYNIQLLYNYKKVNFRLAYNWRDKALLSTNVNPLSFATSGGNPYILNTSPTNFDSTHSYPVYNMVPAYMDAAGYLDLGFDYTVSETVSVSFNANNLLNTKSKTLQEPVPGVFQPYGFNVSDQRYELTVRARF